jgi:hypothetical protein
MFYDNVQSLVVILFFTHVLFVKIHPPPLRSEKSRSFGALSIQKKPQVFDGTERRPDIQKL